MNEPLALKSAKEKLCQERGERYMHAVEAVALFYTVTSIALQAARPEKAASLDRLTDSMTELLVHHVIAVTFNSLAPDQSMDAIGRDIRTLVTAFVGTDLPQW